MICSLLLARILRLVEFVALLCNVCEMRYSNFGTDNEVYIDFIMRLFCWHSNGLFVSGWEKEIYEMS